MVDILILINTLLGFITYMVVQVIVFRKIKQTEVLRGLFSVYIISALTLVIVSLSSYFFSIVQESFAIIFLGLIISFFLYTILILGYIMVIFGITESSVRIRLLREISIFGNGIKVAQILKIYNKDVILEKRLKRFLAAGAISLRNGYYQRERGFSAYTLPDLVIRFFWKLYGGVSS